MEEALTEGGIDYFVEADTYKGRILFFFPTDRVGAFFWVLPEEAVAVRDLLAQKGFTVTVPEGQVGSGITS